MEKTDYLYLSANRVADLRTQFHKLWSDEPVKLNAFISNSEFALNDLTLVILTNNFSTMTIVYHYSKRTKILTATDEENGYQGIIKNMYVIIDHFSNPEHRGQLKSDVEIDYFNSHAKVRLWGAMREQNKKPADWICDLAIVFYMFNLIAMTLPQKLKEKNEKDTKTVLVKTNKGKKYKPVVYLKHTYILDENFKMTKTDIKHIIKCPAWGVRGHPRHLKSGRVVYIKPYVKGKNRNDPNAYVSKDYKI